MYVVGLTGGIACGKTTIASMLRSLGTPMADADAFSHTATAPGGPALHRIRDRFGNAVFHADQTLDRAALARTVFSNHDARRDLENIVHPLVEKLLLQWLDEQRHSSVVVLDIPLLYEAGMEYLTHEVWVVYLPENEQLCRLMARDGLTLESAHTRVASQMPLREKCRRADVIIPMTDTRAGISERVTVQWKRVQALSRLLSEE